MGLLLAVLIVLLGLAMFVACILSGLWKLLTAVRPATTDDRASTARDGLVRLVTALLLAGVPRIAASIAESSTSWVDTDHDGMLDGFINGSYDWVDINGAAWVTAAAVLIIVIAGCVALASAVMRQSHGTVHRRAVSVGG